MRELVGWIADPSTGGTDDENDDRIERAAGSAMSSIRRSTNLLAVLAIGLAASTAGARQEVAQDEALEARLDRQEHELAELRRHLEGPASGTKSGYDGGFFVESADGQWRFTVEGLLQVRDTLFERGLAGRDSGFDLERMRFELGGELYRLYRFHVEPNFDEDGVELEEAWIGAEVGGGDAVLMLGRMKEPFGLEEMLPRRHADFPTFSLLNQFSPAEDHGLTLLGGSLDGPLEYGVAVYNGTGGDETDSDKDVAARFVARPWSGSERSAVRALQFGAAGTFGRADEDASGAELRTEAEVPFLAFEPGSAFDGDRTRLGLEAAWLDGPLALSAEAIRIEQEMVGAGGETEPVVDGWYASASWVLTGEEKTFRGVRPDRPLVGGSDGARGRGAFQLAARYSQLALDDDLVSAGIVTAGAFPDRVDAWDVGLNWYSTANTKVMLHFVHTDYADAIVVDGESRSSEDAILLQFQLHF